MKLSIVSTLYGSASYIEDFYTRVSSAARKLVEDNYEIVLVNDGSPDDSLDRAIKIADSDVRVVVIDLSRNFGHHHAMMTGLKYSVGDTVFLIDSDLEEEPEWLMSFAEKKIETDSDVIFGVQQERRGKFFERFSGRAFYSMFRLLTGIDQPNNIVTARLMSRRYVDALLLHDEHEINIGGLWTLTGFKQVALPVIKLSHSPSTYSLALKFSHLVNAVTSFSSSPLVITFYTGLLISISAFSYILYLVILQLFSSTIPAGYTSTLASIWLATGLIIFFLGVQGIYISKIFSESKNRPNTIVRAVYRSPK